MRRLVNGLLVLSLITAISSTTAHAAPRRDDGDTYWSPIRKIVQIVKRVVKRLDGTDMSYPKP